MANQKSKTARVIKRSAELIQSDSDLAQKMQPAAPAPEAGPSHTELVENSHSENGASPVLDGDLKSPERANVNAMREALEAQAEMEVGKPIAEKQEEIKAEEAGKSVQIDAQPGKQIIINIAYSLNGKKGTKSFSSKAAADAFVKGASQKFGSKIAFIPTPSYDEHSVLHNEMTPNGKKQFFQERHNPQGRAVQCLDCGYIGISNRRGHCFQCDSQAVTDKIYVGKDASKQAGILDLFRGKKKEEPQPQAEVVEPENKIVPKNRPATKIPCRIRVHQEAMGFGQNGQGLEDTKGLVVGLHYPGYAIVEMPSGENRAVPTFALLTTKTGWKFLKEEGERMDQEHAAECKNPNCNRCAYIPGTQANAEAEASSRKMQTEWMQKDDAHVKSCTDPNCDHLAHTRIHKDEVAQKLFGKDFLGLNMNQRSDVYHELYHPKQKKQKKQLPAPAKQLTSSMKTAEYDGWANWATWHVALLIDNTETSYNSKCRLAANAIQKNISAKQLGDQFSRLFRKQYKETVDFYEANAADARDERGRVETKHLENMFGEPQKSGDKATDIVDGLMGLGYEMGMRSGWEDPMEEVNWEEIAEHATAEAREDMEYQQSKQQETPKPQAEKKEEVPQFSDTDMDELKAMGIQGSKKDTMGNEKQAGFDMPDSMMYPSTDGLSRDNDNFDPALVQECATDLFPGFDFAELSQGQQRDVLALARERKNKMSSKKAGDGKVKTEEEIEKEAAFNMFFPGQVVKEFYPELQHDIVDYPNQNNSPMGLHAPEMVGDGGIDGIIDQALDNMGIVEVMQLPADVTDLETVHMADASTSPAGAMGMGRDGKPQVLEGVPLRKENDIRGPMFTEEFYGQYQGISGGALSACASLNKKTAAGAEAEQFAMFLKKVTGEIAATMIAAFKATSRPLLDQVPGVGEVQLAYVEQPQGMSAFNTVNTGSRVKYLMDKLNDSDIQDAINDAWAQAAVWHDGPKGGYVYEVFVRAESIDTDSMIMKYKFVAGTKE